jgi:hypothetical protein
MILPVFFFFGRKAAHVEGLALHVDFDGVLIFEIK